MTTLAYKRWQVALAIRDGQWHELKGINELVGFHAGPCLRDEAKRMANFDRIGTKWKLKPSAIRCLERHETLPRAKPKTRKPPKKRKPRKKQKVRFR